MAHVAVVLVNYRSVAQTLACLQSLVQLTYPDYHIYVVDNASGDHSWQVLSSQVHHVTLIQSETNLGYSGGNNLAIQAALQNPNCQYIWLLNNDTVVAPDALTALVETAQAYPKHLIGSHIINSDGTTQHVGASLQLPRGNLAFEPLSAVQENPEVETLTGCSMLIPRTVIEHIGLLDESYFLYWEDHAYCLKAKQAGYPSRVALNSTVTHEKGASTRHNKPLVTYYYQRNRLQLIKTFFPLKTFQGVMRYTRFRVLRCTIKAWCSFSAQQKQDAKAFWLAIQDFEKGVTGPCPHLL